MSNTHELVPGKRIGPYSLGMAMEAVRATREDWVYEDRDTVEVLEAGGWYVYFEEGLLTQVGAEAPLVVEGPYGLALGIELVAVDGPLVLDPNDFVLTVAGEPGMTIDVSEEGNELESTEVDGSSLISWLGVHTYDELPPYKPVELI